MSVSNKEVVMLIDIKLPKVKRVLVLEIQSVFKWTPTNMEYTMKYRKYGIKITVYLCLFVTYILVYFHAQIQELLAQKTQFSATKLKRS